MLPLFVTNIIGGKKVPVYGDGQQVRDWLHVLDHCRAIDVVLEHGQRGEIYNIGANHQPEWTNMQVTRLILDELGAAADMIEFVADRPGHDRRYAVDIAKLSALGWQPQVAPEAGLRETIRWYNNHPEWWQPITSGEFKKYYDSQYHQ
jgi:dTDP-glucose 4,6-dehydratase